MANDHHPNRHDFLKFFANLLQGISLTDLYDYTTQFWSREHGSLKPVCFQAVAIHQRDPLRGKNNPGIAPVVFF